MSKAMIEALSKKAACVGALDEGTLADARAVLQQVFPRAKLETDRTADLTETVLHMVDQCLPLWTIQLTGKAHEPDGHWRCTLRETSSRDSDEVIGIGSAPTVSMALLRALLRVASMQASS
ncbi:hypothetical protein L0V05_11180 [Tabrizicola sp. J26]|uniref:hypothetical protein n=1 Tax=Alitabrizicola rongguiensis TaxID=2909234 RepID=UPI001F337962|nr:hypothetical protein [Tabrizicola rongguiensis]MCF1709382.1 hypothetical protein [Tabrizicola rongguiensis]